MKTITFEGKTYEYTYTLDDLTDIAMFSEKRDVKALWAAGAKLIKTLLNGSPEEVAMLQFKLSQAIMGEIQASMTGTKNEPVPS